jgi:hypothetical protein
MRADFTRSRRLVASARVRETLVSRVEPYVERPTPCARTADVALVSADGYRVQQSLVQRSLRRPPLG